MVPLIGQPHPCPYLQACQILDRLHQLTELVDCFGQLKVQYRLHGPGVHSLPPLPLPTTTTWTYAFNYFRSSPLAHLGTKDWPPLKRNFSTS